MTRERSIRDRFLDAYLEEGKDGCQRLVDTLGFEQDFTHSLTVGAQEVAAEAVRGDDLDAALTAIGDAMGAAAEYLASTGYWEAQMLLRRLEQSQD